MAVAGIDYGVLAFQLLAKRLRQAGSEGLRRELNTQINRAVKPVVAQIRTGLPDHMPTRYAGVLDPDLQLSIHQRSASDPGVTVTATNRGTQKRKLKQLEAGLLTHPLFGDREHWYRQTPENSKKMSPGYFTGPLNDAQPQVRDAILEAMIRTAQQITGGA